MTFSISWYCRFPGGVSAVISSSDEKWECAFTQIPLGSIGVLRKVVTMSPDAMSMFVRTAKEKKLHCVGGRGRCVRGVVVNTLFREILDNVSVLKILFFQCRGLDIFHSSVLELKPSLHRQRSFHTRWQCVARAQNFVFQKRYSLFVDRTEPLFCQINSQRLINLFWGCAAPIAAPIHGPTFQPPRRRSPWSR